MHVAGLLDMSADSLRVTHLQGKEMFIVGVFCVQWWKTEYYFKVEYNF